MNCVTRPFFLSRFFFSICFPGSGIIIQLGGITYDIVPRPSVTDFNLAGHMPDLKRDGRLNARFGVYLIPGWNDPPLPLPRGIIVSFGIR